jgi:hypothetical protein
MVNNRRTVITLRYGSAVQRTGVLIKYDAVIFCMQEALLAASRYTSDVVAAVTALKVQLWLR